jgi:hypothetical protein
MKQMKSEGKKFHPPLSWLVKCLVGMGVLCNPLLCVDLKCFVQLQLFIINVSLS